MVDTYTANSKARKIEQGGYSGNWANELNDECVELLDDAISGTSAINLGVSTTYSLAALGNGADSESRAFRLSFTGTPASAVTVTVPASVTGSRYLVQNACGQTLTIKYAATAGVAVPTGGFALVFADGTDVHFLYRRVSGSFTITLTGISGTDPTGTAFYDVTNNTVMLKLPALTGTSDATTATLTGMPEFIRPAREQRFYLSTQNNSGSFAVSHCVLDAAGVITLTSNAAGAAFTASGTKSVDAYGITYSLL